MGAALAGACHWRIQPVSVRARVDHLRRRPRSAEEHHRQAGVRLIGARVDFSLSEEQQMLSDGAEKFLAAHYSFEQRRAVLSSPAGVSEQNWQTFAELGWLALPVPEDAGGLGGSFIDTTLIMEAMGRRLVLEPYATTVILAARVIAGSANENLRSSLLSQIAQGACRVALGHGGLARRYDMRNVRTRARIEPDGYVIDGV